MVIQTIIVVLLGELNVKVNNLYGSHGDTSKSCGPSQWIVALVGELNVVIGIKLSYCIVVMVIPAWTAAGTIIELWITMVNSGTLCTR